MKKFSILFLFVTLAMSFSNTEVKSSCPDWADYSGLYMFEIDGCTWAADICWTCPITSSGDVWIAVNKVKRIEPCSSATTYSQAIDEIYNRINTYDWMNGLCGPVTPCPNKVNLKLLRSNCWYKYKTAEGPIEYITCDQLTWCAQDWTYCWDNAYGPKKEPVNGTWYQVGGTPNCQGNEPGDPETGEVSVCWTMFSCD